VVRKEKRRLTGETRQYMLFQSLNYMAIRAGGCRHACGMKGSVREKLRRFITRR
jgi:hypothetical protein